MSTHQSPDPLAIARKAAVGFITHRDHNVSRQVDQLESFILGAIEQATAALRAELEQERLIAAADKAATAPDPMAIAREAAAQIFITTATLPGRVEQAEAIIARAIEQHTQSATAALRAENEKLRARAVLDTCDMGHDYLKLNGEATRCPKCLAEGNDAAMEGQP